MQNKTKVLLLSTLFCLLVFIDTIFKHLADKLLNFGESITFIPNVVSFEKVYNTGAAFGIFTNASVILTIISIIISVFIIIYLFSKNFHKSDIEYFSLIFILAGAIGNTIDRIFYNHVIDFISLQFVSFPVFNFADICINIGVISLLIIYIFGKNNDSGKIYKN